MAGLAVIARTTVELVFPRRCAGCEIPSAPLLCEECAERAHPAAPRELYRFETVLAGFAHEGAPRAALLRAKLGGERRGAAALAVYLPPPPSFDVVTSVPDAYRSRASRGGSVTAALARAYAGRSGITFQTLLKRPRAERDLGGAGRRERFTAMRDVFRPAGPAPASVVLVDDVATTGATALACAEALLAAGATQLALVTFTSADRAPRMQTATMRTRFARSIRSDQFAKHPVQAEAREVSSSYGFRPGPWLR